MFLRFTSKQTYRIILFAIHHSLRCWYLLFKVKSGSRKMSILMFSRIFVYRCHGNIDFYKMQITLKFNPKPTSIANFTLIRQDEDGLRAEFKSEVWSPKNCIETPEHQIIDDLQPIPRDEKDNAMLVQHVKEMS